MKVVYMETMEYNGSAELDFLSIDSTLNSVRQKPSRNPFIMHAARSTKVSTGPLKKFVAILALAHLQMFLLNSDPKRSFNRFLQWLLPEQPLAAL